MNQNEITYRSILAGHGAEFCGVQASPNGNLILFTDRLSGRTWAVAECEFTDEAVQMRLQEGRRAFDLECLVQKSLC